MISIDVLSSEEIDQVDPSEDVVETFEPIQNSSNRKHIAAALFVITSILIGTLTVYFTFKKPDYICQRVHRRTVKDIKNYESHPQSVAIADFNNDSQLDFVIVNTGLDDIDLYLGHQNGTFERQMTYSTGLDSHPCSVAVGNFDNTDEIDIAVANFATNSIAIFLRFHNGSFSLDKSFSTGSSHPRLLFVADLNNDNRLDIAVLNYGTNSVGVFIGSEDGSFAFSMTYGTGYDSLPNSLTIVDLNNDNQLDLVVANYRTDNIGLYFGYGNGTFEDPKIYYTGFRSNPSSVVTGDVNHDDYLDLIVANYGTNNIRIFFGDSNDSFIKQVTYSTGNNSHPEFVAVYDLNKDNQLDIIAIDSINEKVYILPGNENGTFPLLSIYLSNYGSHPVSVVGADFNKNNGTDGLMVVNRDANNVLMLMDYDFRFALSYSTFTAEELSHPVFIATGDLNGDNFLDIVVGNDDNSLINVFLGYGNGNFTLIVTISSDIDSNLAGIVLGDFNNDHRLDIAIINRDNNSLGILLGYGNGMFSPMTTYSTKTVLSAHSFVTGDINNDNCLDIVLISDISDIIGIYIGYCNGTFKMILTYRVRTGWNPSSIVLDDFNSDNNVDLVIAYGQYSAISIFFGDGNGRFPTSRTYPFGDLQQCLGVASGDFNNDHRSDVAAAFSPANKIAIFLGYGNGTFASVRSFPLESCRTPTSIIVGDFNNDDQSDLAVSCFSSSTIVILFGNNNGDFSSQTTYSTGDNSYPYYLVSGDFNNDHKLDMAISDSTGNKVGVLMSYNKADFTIQTKYSTGSSPKPYSVAIADFNKDNLSDLVVVNSGNENIGIRLGFGNGSFGMETTYSTGQNSLPQYVNVGDFNRDNQLDIIIANSKNDSISIFFGNDDGKFESAVTYSMNLQSSPIWIAIADFNNDKWLDLVVTNEGTNNLGILYGYNYTTFVLNQTYSTGYKSFPATVSVVDFNNDNRLDIVVANFQSSSISIFFGDGNGSFTTQITYSTGDESYPISMAVADLNKDGCSDIIVANVGTTSIGILLGDGNGAVGIMMTFPIGAGSHSRAIVVGDVNNDDRLDVIVADKNGNNVGVFLGLGNGSLSLITTYSTGLNSKPESIVLGDVNNDSHLDIVVAQTGSDSVGVLQGYGNGSFALKMTYLLENKSSPFSVALGDFNNDDQLDIAVANFYFDCVDVFLGFGNGSFSEKKTYFTGTGSSPLYVTVSYFNDDDRADIAVICTIDSAVTILFGTEDGGFLMGKKYRTSSNSVSKAMAYGDFNNDSRLDLVVTNMLDDNMDIYLGTGSEPFATALTKSTGFASKPHCVAVGDFNHDDRPDLVVANYGTDNIGIILGNEIDNLSDPLKYSTGVGSRPYAVVVGHFNDDNQLDIAVVNSGSHDVTIFQGYGDGSFTAIRSYSTGTDSRPYSIAVSDFNNDKHLDLAIANAGANNVLILFGSGNGTFGNASSYSMGYNSRPFSVAVGDFNNDGWMDMAVANYEADYVEILLQTC